MTTPTRKRTTSPAFQFYPKEFLSSAKVIAMTATERGVYITLLSIQWLDGSLPDDLAALARLVGINAKAFAKMWPHNLARCFTARHGGRLVNERLERERKKQAEFRQKQATNAEKRWDNQKDATASPPQQSGNALQSPISDLRSPVSDLQSADGRPTARQAPIVARRRKDAFLEYGRLYVPQRVYDDLAMLGNHGPDPAVLVKWFEGVCEDYTNGPLKDARIDADLIAFWKRKYAEKWPATDAQVPKGRPAWVV